MTLTLTKPDYRLVFDRATQAAKDAIAAEVARRPEGNDMDCGFAWVVVRPATGPFIAWCKKQIAAAKDAREAAPYGERNWRQYGDKNWNGGWCFWKPGDYHGQSARFHEAGARAFRDVIAQELGLNVEVGSRLD